MYVRFATSSTDEERLRLFARKCFEDTYVGHPEMNASAEILTAYMDSAFSPEAFAAEMAEEGSAYLICAEHTQGTMTAPTAMGGSYDGLPNTTNTINNKSSMSFSSFFSEGGLSSFASSAGSVSGKTSVLLSPRCDCEGTKEWKEGGNTCNAGCSSKSLQIHHQATTDSHNVHVIDACRCIGGGEDRERGCGLHSIAPSSILDSNSLSVVWMLASASSSSSTSTSSSENLSGPPTIRIACTRTDVLPNFESVPTFPRKLPPPPPHPKAKLLNPLELDVLKSQQPQKRIIPPPPSLTNLLPEAEITPAIISRKIETILGFARVVIGGRDDSLVIKRDPKTGEELDRPLRLHKLYVGKDSIGKRGVGSTLLAMAELIGKVNGCNFMWLGAWKPNTQAISFYRKRGFFHANDMFFEMGGEQYVDTMMRKELLC